MRLSALLFGLLYCMPIALHGQESTADPGARQDAEAAREKLLKAEDQLENVQANSETTRVAVDGVKTDVSSLQQTVTKLQNDNATLKQQLADLQASFDRYKLDQAKANQTLIDNVAAMIASGGKTSKRKKEVAVPAPETPSADASSEVHTAMRSGADLAPPPEDGSGGASTPAPIPEPKAQKGYYHIVAAGETVPAIAEAYQENGVHVTATQIRKANGLTSESVLKPGEKLFIPRADK